MNIPDTRLTDITFHLMVESAPNAIVLVNKAGAIAYVNRQCEYLFGYSAPELISQPIEILIPERFRAHHREYRDAFFEAPTLRAMGVGRDLFGLRKDGSEFQVEIGLNPLVLVDGTWVLATIVDITARKQADERFRKVVQSAPNAMLLVDRDGSIKLVNRQATVLFGYEESELLRQCIDVLVPDKVRSHHAALRESFYANPQTRYMGAGRDLVGKRKDGEEVPVEVGLNPIQTEKGLMVLVSVVDITERRQQEELRAKKEAAEAAYKAKGELLAIASHDLKNPLSAIAGLSEIMLETKKAESGASQQDIEFLQSIHGAARHMFEVVKGILASEGLEQQGLIPNKEMVDVSAMCAELLTFNEQAAHKKGIGIVCNITPGITLHADGTRLREAFDNYISNAVKYSPSGKTVTVSLAPVAGTDLVEFGVRDEGPGLTDDDKSKMFGKFKKLSAKPTGGESSTGLGLSIVKAIVELHKGSVGCDSTYGQGAYFWARLPLK